MSLKSTTIPMAIALLAISLLPANSQNLQNWANNDANQIRQDAAKGLINPDQANRLERQDARIQNQAGQEMIQNGGYLTPQEKGQIQSELRNLNQHTNNDIQKDRNGYVPPQGAPGWQNWNRNPYNSNPYNPNLPANPYYSQGQQPSPNGYQRHHHHHQQQYDQNGQPIYPH